MGTLRIFPTTFFVMLGYLVKKPIKKIEALGNKRWIIIVALFGVQTILCLHWNENIDVQVFKLGNSWLYFIKGIIGSLAIIIFSQMIHSNAAIRLGRKTKELMILHYPPFYYTLVLRYLLGKIFEPNVIGVIIITAITIACCLIVDWICSKVPIWNFVMGRTEQTKMV